MATPAFKPLMERDPPSVPNCVILSPCRERMEPESLPALPDEVKGEIERAIVHDTEDLMVGVSKLPSLESPAHLAGSIAPLERSL